MEFSKTQLQEEWSLDFFAYFPDKKRFFIILTKNLDFWSEVYNTNLLIYKINNDFTWSLELDAKNLISNHTPLPIETNNTLQHTYENGLFEEGENKWNSPAIN